MPGQQRGAPPQSSSAGSYAAKWVPHRDRRLAVCLLLACSLLGGCGIANQRKAGLGQLQQAREAGFEQQTWRHDGFTFLTLTRDMDVEGMPVVFVEGDGKAWQSRWQASTDPTPAEPVALQLAMALKGRPVIYLARPCQYLSAAQRVSCRPRYWTTHRFAPDVLDASRHALDSLNEGAPFEGLLGYSGGGDLAALLAARLEARWLITLAANLDHAYWTRHHGVTPLHGSINPVQAADRLARLPQLHLVGHADERVPPDVVRSFLAALPAGHQAAMKIVEGYDHSCCWVRDWPDTLCRLSRTDRPWFTTFCAGATR